MLKVHILQSRYVRKGGLGRIFYMRILLILVFTALFSCSAIMAEEVSARHDGLTVSGDGCSVSFSSGRITIRSPYFKAGDIGRFGLLRTIADPYSSAFSLRPEISLHQRYSRQSGFAAGMDGFIAGASLSGRPLVFIQSGKSVRPVVSVAENQRFRGFFLIRIQFYSNAIRSDTVLIVIVVPNLFH